jgi:hypothetical protein
VINDAHLIGLGVAHTNGHVMIFKSGFHGPKRQYDGKSF